MCLLIHKDILKNDFVLFIEEFKCIRNKLELNILVSIIFLQSFHRPIIFFPITGYLPGRYKYVSVKFSILPWISVNKSWVDVDMVFFPLLIYQLFGSHTTWISSDLLYFNSEALARIFFQLCL